MKAPLAWSFNLALKYITPLLDYGWKFYQNYNHICELVDWIKILQLEITWLWEGLGAFRGWRLIKS
jgi:hypothetical protein